MKNFQIIIIIIIIKRTGRIVDFDVPADHSVKLKESQKRDMCLNLARELKKLWNVKVMVISIVIGTLGTVTKGLVQGQKNLEIREDHSNYSIVEISKNTKWYP